MDFFTSGILAGSVGTTCLPQTLQRSRARGSTHSLCRKSTTGQRLGSAWKFCSSRCCRRCASCAVSSECVTSALAIFALPAVCLALAFRAFLEPCPEPAPALAMLPSSPVPMALGGSARWAAFCLACTAYSAPSSGGRLCCSTSTVGALAGYCSSMASRTLIRYCPSRTSTSTTPFLSLTCVSAQSVVLHSCFICACVQAAGPS
mmetsp:Transcript_31219/g.78218  ORF Transcript_31219/g.78218 Transcript_31219/m.78218 type:complete len:204 (-) Transcript_31219:58-669(-)